MKSEELPKRYSEIDSLILSGKTQSQVAKILGISRQRVNQIYLNYSSIPSGIRSQVRRRDGTMCRVCFYKHDLHVHHINTNSHDNRLDNLVTLCDFCHKKAHIITKSLYLQNNI